MKKSNIKRFEEIDMLRGLAVIIMILLHTNAYFLKNPVSYFTWDWGQFAVPVFIFCSSYVFFQKQYSFTSILDFFSYVKKRIIRLLIPYYFFVLIFFLLIYLKEPSKLTLNYVFQNIFLSGGIDINWLILLFVYFSFIMPFLSWTYTYKKNVFVIYSVISVVSALLLMFIKFPFNYRIIMWLPWSLLIIINLLIAKYEKNNKIMFGIFTFSIFLFVILYIVQSKLNHSLIMYDNKYPPNLYHLSFCISSTMIVYWAAKKKFFSLFPIKQLFAFLSKYSYSIYFVHYCIIFILFVFTKIKFNWITFFITVLTSTIVVQFGIEKLYHLFSTLKRGPTI